MKTQWTVSSRMLLIVSMILTAGLITSHPLQAQEAAVQIRKVSGLPEGRYYWIVSAYQNRVFVVDTGGNKARITGTPHLRHPDDPPRLPRFVAQVDPQKEAVVSSFTTYRWHPIALSSQAEQREDSWLANQYDYCFVDDKKQKAFALPGLFLIDENKAMQNIHVLDLSAQKLMKKIAVPDVSAIALNPNKTKLYAALPSVEDAPSIINVYSPGTLEVQKSIKMPELVMPIINFEFSKDAKLLFASVKNEGVLILDCKKDTLENWDGQKGSVTKFGLENYFLAGWITLSSDGRELYLLLHERSAQELSAIAAIDIQQKKLTRLLKLDGANCRSVAVIGNKLFAAYLEGVFVIDIEQWRKQKADK